MTDKNHNRRHRHALTRQKLRERLMREQVDHIIEERRKSSENQENFYELKNKNTEGRS